MKKEKNRTGQEHIRDIATQHFKRRFNSKIPREARNEKVLLNAISEHGKRVPDHLLDALESEAVLSPKQIQAAIAGLKSGKTPGTDGFPSEYFKLFCLRNTKDEKCFANFLVRIVITDTRLAMSTPMDSRIARNIDWVSAIYRRVKTLLLFLGLTDRV